MRDRSEFEQELMFGALMKGASITKVAEPFGFSRVPYRRLWYNSRNEAKPLAIAAIEAGLANLLTVTVGHWNAIRQLILGLLWPRRLLSWIIIGIIQFVLKLFVVRSIRQDIIEDPRKGNLFSPLEIFRKGGSGAGISILDLQTNRKQVISSEEFSFYILPISGRFYNYGGSPKKVANLTAFFQQYRMGRGSINDSLGAHIMEISKPNSGSAW